MNRNDVAMVWDELHLSCRNSYTPAYAQRFLARFGLELPQRLIYTKDRYREQSDGSPRVDGEDLLIFVCKHFGILPDKEELELSNKMSGEGSRRQCVEDAYLGRKH